jgi:hypothetical protein
MSDDVVLKEKFSYTHKWFMFVAMRASKVP